MQSLAAAPIPDARFDDKVMAEVKRYARGKFRAKCESAQTKGAPSHLQYRCTCGCNYSTRKRDEWNRHEQKWQPQSFWHCIACRDAKQPPTIMTRIDKVVPHLRKVHGFTEGEANQLRDASRVPYRAGFETHCKFFCVGRECGYKFKSWEDRKKHYFDHFQDKVPDGPWQLRYSRNRWPDEDEDDQQNGGGTSSSTSSKSALSSGTASGSYWSTGGSGKTHCIGPQDDDCGLVETAADCSPGDDNKNAQLTGFRAGRAPPKTISNEPCMSSRSRPRKLIDVARRWFVNPPEDAKYLALDYGWTKQDAMHVCAVATKSPDKRQAQHSRIDCLPLPFEKVIFLAKDLGYKYLWIAELCEETKGDGCFSAILESATLTIVPVQPQQSIHQTWYFISHYRRLQQVCTWAKDSIPFSHIQNLGHGAYGIVDEVRLQSRLGYDAYCIFDEVRLSPLAPSLVRKELSLSRTRRRLSLTPLQEIEVMQKLNHPHIVRFVAAYYEHERRSLNILMTPVAQCNLRDFLSDPLRWPDKKPHLPSWYVSLASALSYLHGICVRHKDIKPANILIHGHVVLLSDFGTSQAFSINDTKSRGNAFMTPKYCAPEVAAKGMRGRKSDIFSLGCVFTEMVTVELGATLESLYAFMGGAEDNRNHDAYHQQLPVLARWLAGLRIRISTVRQKHLLRLCKSMLALDPEERPSAGEVFQDLGRHLPPSCDHLGAKAVGHLYRAQMGARREPRVVHSRGTDSLRNEAGLGCRDGPCSGGPVDRSSRMLRSKHHKVPFRPGSSLEVQFYQHWWSTSGRLKGAWWDRTWIVQEFKYPRQAIVLPALSLVTLMDLTFGFSANPHKVTAKADSAGLKPQESAFCDLHSAIFHVLVIEGTWPSYAKGRSRQISAQVSVVVLAVPVLRRGARAISSGTRHTLRKATSTSLSSLPYVHDCSRSMHGSFKASSKPQVTAARLPVRALLESTAEELCSIAACTRATPEDVTLLKQAEKHGLEASRTT